MPIPSTYSPASDKLALPRAGAIARASLDDSKTNFKTLLDAAKPKETPPVKPNRESQPADNKDVSENLKDENPKPQNADVKQENASETETPQSTPSQEEPTGDIVELTPEEPAVEVTATAEGQAAVNFTLPEPLTTPEEEAAVVDVEETQTDAQGEVLDPDGASIQTQTTVLAAVTTAHNEPLVQSNEIASDLSETAVSQAANNALPPEKPAAGLEGARDAKEVKGLKKSEARIELPEVAPLPAEDVPAEEFGKILEHLIPKTSSEETVLTGTQTFQPTPKADEVQAASPTPVMNPASAMEENQDRIITGIQSQISTKGGTMRIRLDPPELGAMQVKVEMRGERLSATFQASNDQAAKMLTQGLEQLKTALEKQGISVDRLQVQTTRNESEQGMNADSGDSSAGGWQGYQNQQDQQRRQTLSRLWKRAAFGRDPLDMVA